MLHDFNDPFLEAAKLMRYVGSGDGSSVMFVAFVAGWFVTRLWLFPVRVIRSTLFETRVRCIHSAAICQQQFVVVVVVVVGVCTYQCALCITPPIFHARCVQLRSMCRWSHTTPSSTACCCFCWSCTSTGASTHCRQHHPLTTDNRSYLILKIIVRQLTQGKLSDVREDDDTDDDEVKED